jgi:hypothetical protein
MILCCWLLVGHQQEPRLLGHGEHTETRCDAEFSLDLAVLEVDPGILRPMRCPIQSLIWKGGKQVEGVLIGWTERIKGKGFPSS